MPIQQKDASASPPQTTFAAKSINKWGLVAPFDHSITDAQWEVYYQQRSKLEEDFNNTAWKDEEFKGEEHPGMRRFALGRDVGKSLLGCPSVANREELANVLEGSVYFLPNWQIIWDCDDPREIDGKFRVYSPLGTTVYVDLHYEYYQRTGWSFVAASCKLQVDVRDVSGESEMTKVLFNMNYKEKSHRQARRVAAKGTYTKIGKHLLGSAKVSEWKLFCMMMSAVGLTQHLEPHEWVGWVHRVGARRYKKGRNETGDDFPKGVDDKESNKSSYSPEEELEDESDLDSDLYYPF